MTIYKIEDYLKDKEMGPNVGADLRGMHSPSYIRDQVKKFSEKRRKGRFFSSLISRFFFLLLLVADILWGVFSFLFFLFKLLLNCLTLFISPTLKESMKYSWLCVQRSLVCFAALFIAIFNPSLGIMVACLYFLMYDKSGVEEIVPSSLRDQFRDFFPS